MGAVTIVKRSAYVVGLLIVSATFWGCASKPPACYDTHSSDLDAHSNACLSLFSKDAGQARKDLDEKRTDLWAQTRKADKATQNYRELTEANYGVAEAAKSASLRNKNAEQKRMAMALFARVSTKNLQRDSKPSEAGATSDDYRMATEALEACASRGDADCQKDLAELLVDQNNPKKSETEADKWLEKIRRAERDW